jgi:hypothetical protein
MMTTYTKAGLALVALAAMGGCSAGDETAGEETTGAKSEAIVNGTVGVFRHFQAAIAIVGNGKQPGQQCSGVFVSPHAVLTAKHCASYASKPGAVVMRGPSIFKPTQVSRLRVKYGAVDFREAPNYGCAPNAVRPGSRCLQSIDSHDIALLVVEDAYNGPRVGGGFDPIATVNETYSNILVAGYGPLENGQQSGIARYVGTTEYPLEAFPEQLLYLDDEKSTRGGDSGGPTYALRDGKPMIVGVHQGGALFPDPSAPRLASRHGFDSRVSVDAEWIKKTIADIEAEFDPKPPPPDVPTCNETQTSCGGTPSNNCECTNGCFYNPPSWSLGLDGNPVEPGIPGGVCCGDFCSSSPGCWHASCES